jgi:ADP-heptose:LPS heptosyltransferase/SAM-dependent methyltransferase
MVWKRDGKEGFESIKIRWELVPYTRGQGLDVGCGESKPFRHFIGLDNFADLQMFGNKCTPDVFANADDLSLFANESMDFVFSSHVLEHIVDYEKCLKEWWRVLKHEKYLCLYLPHRDFYPTIESKQGNPDHKHDFLPSDITETMHRVGGWDLIRNEVRTEGDEYSFFQVYKKLRGNRHHESWAKPKPEKSAGVVRYGAIGDMIQTASVCKGLKDQGFHVTLYTSPPGDQVILHDPHIDEIVLQDKDQVPNHLLGPFWESLEKKHQRFVNLSESCERSLLSMKGTSQHAWNPAARHKMMNLNYLEFQHAVGSVPHKPQVRFYATAEEKAWARKERLQFGEFAVLWSLAGSSVHKTWPYIDNVVAALMIHHPGTHVVFVGDELCQILEAGWDNEPRVHRKSGKYTVRQTLSLLEEVDCIIGTETGVLNAACSLPVPKIVLLSHSTVENLTRDWTNTHSLVAENVTCHGRGKNEAPACHMLHYGWEHCTKDYDPACADCVAGTCKTHTYAAMCSASIQPDRVTDIILPLIEKRKVA